MSRLLFIATLLLAVGLAAPAAAQHKARKVAERSSHRGAPYAGHAEAMRWAESLAERRGLDPQWVRQALGRAQLLPVVARLMQPAPSGTPKNWRAYRSRFIDPVRIAAGVRFWEQNQAVLERAEQQYGVPAELIVGVIGVETIYGQQMGNFRVIDALATLAFDFPAAHPRAAERSAYFRGELEHFLMLQARRRADPLQPLGSYAGATGMPQFMPSSIVRWAVDFDADGRVDLAASPADVIGSVANYFKSYGWQPGMPTHYPVRFDPERVDLDALLAPDILPTFSVPSMLAKGVLLDGPALQHEGPLALVELQNGAAEPKYVAGTENFYVITRYNWSSYYAMAVIELGQEVRQAMGLQPSAAPVAEPPVAEPPEAAAEPPRAAPEPLPPIPEPLPASPPAAVEPPPGPALAGASHHRAEAAGQDASARLTTGLRVVLWHTSKSTETSIAVMLLPAQEQTCRMQSQRGVVAKLLLREYDPHVPPAQHLGEGCRIIDAAEARIRVRGVERQVEDDHGVRAPQHQVAVVERSRPAGVGRQCLRQFHVLFIAIQVRHVEGERQQGSEGTSGFVVGERDREAAITDHHPHAPFLWRGRDRATASSRGDGERMHESKAKRCRSEGSGCHGLRPRRVAQHAIDEPAGASSSEAT